MFRDEKIGKDFAGSQNPWIKRLGLFFLIVGLSAKFWETHIHLFMGLLIFIIISAIIWGFFKIFVGDIKDLFK